MEEKVVAIDFDGVIVEYEEWKGKDHVGDVRWDDGPRRNLERLKEAGLAVMIYTCRPHHEPIVDLLSEHDIPYDWINSNPTQPEGVSEHKLFANWYIDDRFPTFESLTDSVDIILDELEEEKRENRAKEEDMSIKQLRPGQYLVKDRYVVDLEHDSCTCPDHTYRGTKCKHIQFVEKRKGD